MSLERPPLSSLVSRVTSDLVTHLSLAGSLVRRAMADVLGRVWGGGLHLIWGYLVWLSRQLFADTADREFLLQQASLYGISLKAATYSSGIVTATGVDASTIPVDTILLGPQGAQYRVTALATIASGEAAVAVTAVDAGSDGNLDEGEVLSFESPITGVDSAATVDEDGLEGGFDEETIEQLRARYIQRLREPPEGGTDEDYKRWALEVAGVTRAFVYRHELGLGTVVVRFVLDEEDDIFPNPTVVESVQTKLDSERPTTAEVTAEAPTPSTVAFTITVSPNTDAVKAAVQAELKDLLIRVAEPGDGAGRGTVFLSQMRTAIGVAEGIEDYTLTVPSANVVPALGELPVLGTITWGP